MSNQAIFKPRGRFFQEFQLGDRMISTGRTITETDIVNFAALSGDYHQIHTNAEYAKGSLYGQRVAHGLLVLSIAGGLAAQVGFMEGTVIAFRGLTWKFSKPVFIGDTIHLEASVSELKAMRRLMGGGAVTLKVLVVNQRGETVARGTWSALFAGLPELAAE